ncbi:MAG: hypothetical protein WD049_08525 [Candidatus Paceibacterota bacterium]
MKPINSRRTFFVTFAGALAGASGCDRDGDGSDGTGAIGEAIDGASTEDLKTARLALRGYEIVSLTIARRVVFLPYPGMRIVAVFLVATTVAAHLVVKYIDEELIMRRIEETLSSEEKLAVEGDGYVEFETESGLLEKVYLAPTKYAD